MSESTKWTMGEPVFVPGPDPLVEAHKSISNLRYSLESAQSFSRLVLKTNSELLGENARLREELIELRSVRARLRSWGQFIRECWRGET